MSEITSTIQATARSRRLSENQFMRLLGAAGVFALVGLLFAIGCAMSRDFLTASNLLNTLRAVTLLGIVVVGVSFVTYSGHFVDLSIPGIMALSGITAVAALPLGFAAALACGVGAGVAIGLINGVAIGYLRLNPIIWTLAMMSILDGVVRLVFSGKQVYPDESTRAGREMLALYAVDLPFAVPLIGAILAIMVGVAWVLLNRTGFGARLKYTGASYEAARMSGINVCGVVATAFVLSALTSAIGGILLTSLNKVGAAYIGAGYDFTAITAVVIGGVTLAGGRGGIFGAIGGVLVIGLLRNILTLMGMGSFAQVVVQGFVFILVVGVGAYALRRSGRDDA